MITRTTTLLFTLTAIVTAVAAALTAFLPDILLGPAFTNGNARGTALVMLFGAVPVLLIATFGAQRGSWRGVVVALGALAYLSYNDVMLLFATPFNRLFLFYESAFALAIFTGIVALTTIDLGSLAERIRPLPARPLAGYAFTIIVLNTLGWLAGIVPAVLGPQPAPFLEDLGVATNPVYVQDLAFWLPGAAIVAWLLWQRRAVGIVLIGAWLVYGFMESVGVAIDQWFGSMADPSMASVAAGPIALFVVLAVIGVVPLFLYFRPRPASVAREAHAHLAPAEGRA